MTGAGREIDRELRHLGDRLKGWRLRPILNPRNSTFGRVTNTSIVVWPKEYQLGLKLIF